MKKGRHRRFEEARKLKREGPGAFLPPDRNGSPSPEQPAEDDEFADLAAKYGAFDEDDDDDESSQGRAESP